MAIQIHYWTKDVGRIIEHYTKVLGFELAYSQPKEGPPNFCILTLGEATIMFALTPKDEARKDREVSKRARERMGKPGPISVYVKVDDLDAHHAACKDHEANIIEPLWDTPWQTWQFTVLDPDGNMMTFYVDR